MKKILIISSVCGFLPKFEREDVKLLKELGYQVHYASNSNNPVYPYKENIFEEMGIVFHDIDLWQSPFGITHNRKAIGQIRKIIEKENISVVHCHTPTGGLVGRLACKPLGTYVIYTAHGFHFYRGGGFFNYHLYHGIEKFLSRMTDVIVTINDEDYRAARRMKQRISAEKIPGVGLDMDYFSLTAQEARKEARRALKLKEEFFLISVGELRENKNQSAILKALGILKNKGMDMANFRYGLLGAGRQEPELRNLAECLGLGNVAVFYGYRQDIRPFLKAADALIFPSIREGLGMAALEAMSTGLPVIASDNRGTREYMINNENGLVARENTPEEFARLIEGMHESREGWSGSPKSRELIRQSVEKFEKQYAATVMRRVYEKACR